MSTETTWQSPTSQSTKTRKPWYRRWWGIGLIVLGALALIGIISGGDPEPTRAVAPVGAGTETATAPETVAAPVPAPATVAPEPPAEPEELPGVGAVVSDGKFTFTVEEFTCGAAEVGTNEFLQEQAQGQFCVAYMNVTNSGDAAQTMFAENQYLYNQAGQKYSADSMATYSANVPEGGTSSLWMEEINPGNAVSGAVVFDVPLDFQPGVLELHDSAFSGGVEINVS